jgi:hypothetical protein
MARPIKRGLTYFPLDVDLFGNRKIRRLIDKFGCEGALVYFAILCETYAVEGYFIPYRRTLCFDIAYLLHLDEACVKEVLTFCVKIELFDAKMLKKNQVLSSVSIQKRYLEVAKRLRRRGDTEVLNFESIGVIAEQNKVIAEQTPVVVEQTPIIVSNKYTKERKEKEIKTNKEKTKKEILVINNLKREKSYSPLQAAILFDHFGNPEVWSNNTIMP